MIDSTECITKRNTSDDAILTTASSSSSLEIDAQSSTQSWSISFDWSLPASLLGFGSRQHKIRREFQNRIESIRNNNRIQNELSPPKWNNSFKAESPYFGIGLFIAFYGFFIGYLTDQFEMSPIAKVAGGIIYLCYISDCLFNGVLDYFKNQMNPGEFIEYIEQLKKMPIQIIYNVKAYHYVTISHYDKETKKETTTTERRNTYEEDFVLPLTMQIDATKDCRELLKKNGQVRIHNFITYSYGNEESQRCLEQLRLFAEMKASGMDTEIEVNERVEHAKIKTNILVIDTTEKANPIFSKFVYFVYCAVGLSLLYRVLLNKRIAFFQHVVQKKIFSTEVVCLGITNPLQQLLMQQQAQIGNLNINNNQRNNVQNQTLIGNQYTSSPGIGTPQPSNISNPTVTGPSIPSDFSQPKVVGPTIPSNLVQPQVEGPQIPSDFNQPQVVGPSLPNNIGQPQVEGPSLPSDLNQQQVTVPSLPSVN